MYDSRSVQVGRFSVHGHGLFAVRFFTACDVVLSFEGLTVAMDGLSPAFLLKAGELLQAINHQARPNPVVDCNRLRLVAVRTIDRGRIDGRLLRDRARWNDARPSADLARSDAAATRCDRAGESGFRGAARLARAAIEDSRFGAPAPRSNDGC
jgi:hypothetical protein